MEILIEYGLFVLKAFTIIVLIFIPIFFLVSSMRQPPETNESLKIKNLTKRYQSMANSLKVLTMNKEEKKKFLPLFFIAQILDIVVLEKLKFSKSEISKTKLLRKWHFFLKNKNIYQLNELDRFKLHQELEMFLPSFIFYLPQNLQFDWLKRWRDKEDKLFHPSNLLNGDVIKKYLKIEDGPILGELLQYLSKELAYKRLNNFDEAIYKAEQWIEQNAPKCD